jgi:alcohol dehydrogenase (cytochrome c)
LFTSNGTYLIAMDPANGKLLWRSSLTASPSSGPITYMIDGKQYVLVCAGDTLFSFAVNEPGK